MSIRMEPSTADGRVRNGTDTRLEGDRYMDFRQIECFVAAVDEGSFSNAAERLQLSQSTVTIHIRNLESELDTRLLNRTTRSMELSSAGRTFYTYAKQMLKLNRDSIFALSRANADVRSVNIVATPYIIRYYLAERAVQFHREHPNVSLRFITCGTPETLNKLQSESAEFAFCPMKLMSSDYAVKHCDRADLVVITPDRPKFRSLRGQVFPNHLFGEEPLITRSSTSTLQQEFLRWSKANIPNVKLNVIASVDDTETIIHLVEAGMGISVISEAAIGRAVSAGRVLSFPIEGTRPYHLYFAYRKRYLTEEQTLFRDYILEHITDKGEDA